MNIFGHEDTRTEEERRTDKELSNLLDKYQERFNKCIGTEPSLGISDKELIEVLKRCLKEGIALDVIYPEINDYEEDDDL